MGMGMGKTSPPSRSALQRTRAHGRLARLFPLRLRIVAAASAAAHNLLFSHAYKGLLCCSGDAWPQLLGSVKGVEVRDATDEAHVYGTAAAKRRDGQLECRRGISDAVRRRYTLSASLPFSARLQAQARAA
jgi:hypothetical protein